MHFHIRTEWILYDGREVLWLPPDCRRRSNRAFYANALAWGDEDSNVHYFAFDPAAMANADNRPFTRTFTCLWERPHHGLADKCRRILRMGDALW